MLRCRSLVAVIVTASLASSLRAAEPYRQTLISVERNIRIEDWRVTHRDVHGEGSKAWSVTKSVLRGGKQEGVDLITVDNGRMTITIIPTRGMSVLNVRMGEVRLGWDSPVKQVVHPRHINLESRGGLGWLEGFNEWMVRCGLEWAGQAGPDKFINNTGDEAQMDLTLHGKIGNIPASEVEVVVDRDAPRRIRIRGRVDERMFYGPKLELWTEVSTEVGSNVLRFDDAVTNHGAFEQEFQLIYHANHGGPLLEQGAAFVAPLQRVTPFNDHAAKDVKRFDQYAGPTKGFVEQVYLLLPRADEAGRTTIMLRNAAGDKAVSMSWPVEQLPYLTLWKNLAAEADGYVTGLEPATGFPNHRSVERAAGRVPKLGPGQTRRFSLEVGLHDGRESIAELAERIAAIQGGEPATVDSAPGGK